MLADPFRQKPIEGSVVLTQFTLRLSPFGDGKRERRTLARHQPSRSGRLILPASSFEILDADSFNDVFIAYLT